VIDLDLAPVGNCSVASLIDRQGRHIWACAPRYDSDPVFCALLGGKDPADNDAIGLWAVDLEGLAEARQGYLRNTPILRTELIDKRGGALEILDFAPRYRHLGRLYRPVTLARLVRPLRGSPRISIRLRPAYDWGAARAERTSGSNHIRYIGKDVTLRLTTNCPVSHILTERTFRLEDPLSLFLGPDEPFEGDLLATTQRMLDETRRYWMEWVRTLSLPLDWQEAVIRAAITLKLCAYEETGAIVAAFTTSIPEHADSGRNWDYRYCWVRDAYYVIQALNRLGAVDILENFQSFLRNLVDSAPAGRVQPVYGVGLEPVLTERTVTSLPGYRGMGPVRVGNQAHEHDQHDVYGQIVLSSVQAFFDQRLLRAATLEDFKALEQVGERAYAMSDKPDAGLWEFRTRAAVHTYSAMMCWAACDRLANAAGALQQPGREAFWNERAAEIRRNIETQAYNEALGRYAASFGGDELDASLLQMVDLRFSSHDDPRYRATFAAIDKELRRGPYLLRYAIPDDFGAPQTAFNFCTFWFIEALYLAGRAEEARDLFDQMLSRRTHAGLFSEDISFADGELWGNYPQTYSLVGLINCAVLLSRPWSSVR
jgi:GH15 family glucan-1,4-alpha-glucosidase